MVMLQRKWGMHHPRRGDGMPRGGKKDGEPSVKSDQRMVNTSPRVAELGVMSHARMTGTNLSVRVRVSAMEPSSRSVNSRWSVLSLWVRSEEHTSELLSLMRISYAVF